METQFTRKPGRRVKAYTSTFPARRYWYRHDTVLADGKPLEGHVQVRVIHGRVEVHTGYRNAGVLGYQPDWLYRMNQTMERKEVQA